MQLYDDVRYLKGIGEARAKLLEKLDIRTVYDLISYFPRGYEDRSVIRYLSEIGEGETACVRAVVISTPVLSRIRKGLNLTRFRIADDSGSAEVTFFNQPYIKNNLRVGSRYSFYGRFQRFGSKLGLQNPTYEPASEEGKTTGRIVPVYRLTAGISQNVLLKSIRQGLDECLGELRDLLPEETIRRYDLPEIRKAYRSIHMPSDMAEAMRARERLVFEELFVLACALGSMKDQRRNEAGHVIPETDLREFTAALPFSLTGAQTRAIRESLGDMASGHAMNRLVQGDVGSGKTMVAAACIWAVCRAGFQSAFMAPTELLADQHFRTFSQLLEPMGIRVVLLKSSMSAKQKREAVEKLALGEADLAVGTHALLSEGVEFPRLALAVTDEQHRFGVAQRSALAAKTSAPHVLVMSATPIPRTLALILYGDLDVSIIDELPPGRQKVETYAVEESMRPRIQRFIARLVEEGRQVYVVCPMIEEDEEGMLDLRSAQEVYDQLRTEVFPQYRLGLLHGKMKTAEKEAVMTAFVSGEIQILVSTTVVEVGVDVPNAALMVVENADRFGLSQLHQLRGRVGRGKHKSYCVLFKGKGGGISAERLDALVKESDGFRISEEDLKLRGPGDFFGSRQHGLPTLHIADLASSLDVLKEAQAEAARLLAEDPSLSGHPALRRRVESIFRNAETG